MRPLRHHPLWSNPVAWIIALASIAAPVAVHMQSAPVVPDRIVEPLRAWQQEQVSRVGGVIPADDYRRRAAATSLLKFPSGRVEGLYGNADFVGEVLTDRTSFDQDLETSLKGLGYWESANPALPMDSDRMNSHMPLWQIAGGNLGMLRTHLTEAAVLAAREDFAAGKGTAEPAMALARAAALTGRVRNVSGVAAFEHQMSLLRLTAVARLLMEYSRTEESDAALQRVVRAMRRETLGDDRVAVVSSALEDIDDRERGSVYTLPEWYAYRISALEAWRQLAQDSGALADGIKDSRRLDPRWANNQSIVHPWTRTMALRASLGRAIAADESIMREAGLPFDLYRQLTPSEMASAYTPSFNTMSLGKSAHRLKRIVATELALLECALAARRFQRAEGRVPATLEELVPTWIESLPESNDSPALTWETGSQAHGPLRCGWMAITYLNDQPFLPAAVSRLRSQHQAQVVLNPGGPPAEEVILTPISPQWDGRRMLRSMLLILASLERDPQPMPVSFEFEYGQEPQRDPFGDDPKVMGFQRLEEAPDPSWKFTTYRSGEGSNVLAELLAPERLNDLEIRNLRLRVEMPSRVFAVWSPSVNGIDEEGRVGLLGRLRGWSNPDVFEEGDQVVPVSFAP